VIGLILLGGGLLVLTFKLTRVYDLSPALERLSGKVSPKAAQIVHRIQPERVVYGLLIILPVCLGAVFLGLSSKSNQRVVEETPRAQEGGNIPVVRSPKPRSGKAAAIHSCNVLKVGTDARQLWQFDARNGDFVLNRQQTSLPGEPLPSKLVS